MPAFHYWSSTYREPQAAGRGGSSSLLAQGTHLWDVFRVQSQSPNYRAPGLAEPPEIICSTLDFADGSTYMERVSDLLKVTQRDSGQISRQPVPRSLCFPLHPVAIGGWGWWLSLYEQLSEGKQTYFPSVLQINKELRWGRKSNSKGISRRKNWKAWEINS